VPGSNPREASPPGIRLRAAAVGLAAIVFSSGCTGLAAEGLRGSTGGPAGVVEALVSAGRETLTEQAAERGQRASRALDEPHPASADLKPRPRPGSFEMNLSGKRHFVSQATEYWCVAAAMQTMMNIIDKRQPDRTARLQERLYQLGRRVSDKKARRIGIHPDGWSEGLNREGYGPYEVHVARSRKAAIRTAARAMRLTGRPVGLVTWRGAHSWVMHGFKATADPAFEHDFKVTHVRTHDVWYPRVSSIWGPSAAPDTLIPAAKLAEDFLAFRRPGRRYPKWDGRYLLILPVPESAVLADTPREEG
jgi:hypothetical protein